MRLSKTTSFTFPLEQAEDIALTDGSLDVAYNGTASGTTTVIIHEFDADLCHVTSVSGSAQHAADLGKLNGLILCKE